MSDHTQQPIYQDRFTGENFQDARTMLNRYLAKFCEHMKLPAIELDGAGHADLQRGSATIGINMLETQGDILDRLGRYAEAREAYKAARKLKPRSKELLKKYLKAIRKAKNAEG